MEEVYRPPAGPRKIHSSNDFELCYLRHQYLRRVKYNPTPEQMEPYKRIISYMAMRTWYTYQGLFHIVGFTLEDINVVGKINLVSFIGLFEIGPDKNPKKYSKFCAVVQSIRKRQPTAEDVLNKNKADLTAFMKQRMEDLVRICRQKAKNIKGMRVDEFIPFYGTQPPPEDLYKLLEDNELYGYKRLDMSQFKSIRKKAKGKVGETFRFGGQWYVTVPLDQRSVTVLDLAGAGLDPHESFHNLNPEEILFRREAEKKFDIRVKRYKNSSKEDKARIMLSFVEKNAENPKFENEIRTARRLLRNMGYLDVK